MVKQSGWITPHALAVVVIAITALLSRLFYPDQWALLDTARLLLWPQVLVSSLILAMWVAVWIHALKRVRIHPLLALATLALTILPLLNDAQYWECVVGECFW